MANTSFSPDKAFILAAGFGKRLRPYTNDIPKPMVAVNDVPMIDEALDKLSGLGVRECVINTHYKANSLKEHLRTRTDPKIIISHEEELLDTGGSIKNNLHHFEAPFFVLSGDSVWDEAPDKKALETLAAQWNPQIMDILILLQPVSSMTLTHGVGDYDLSPDGQATRSREQQGQYMFTSIRINAPSIFDDAPAEPFSYLQLLDEAEKRGRLYGIVHEGQWHHISTPEDLNAVNAARKT